MTGRDIELVDTISPSGSRIESARSTGAASLWFNPGNSNYGGQSVSGMPEEEFKSISAEARARNMTFGDIYKERYASGKLSQHVQIEESAFRQYVSDRIGGESAAEVSGKNLPKAENRIESEIQSGYVKPRASFSERFMKNVIGLPEYSPQVPTEPGRFKSTEQIRKELIEQKIRESGGKITSVGFSEGKESEEALARRIEEVPSYFRQSPALTALFLNRIGEKTTKEEVERVVVRKAEIKALGGYGYYEVGEKKIDPFGYEVGEGGLRTGIKYSFLYEVPKDLKLNLWKGTEQAEVLTIKGGKYPLEVEGGEFKGGVEVWKLERIPSTHPVKEPPLSLGSAWNFLTGRGYYENRPFGSYAEDVAGRHVELERGRIEKESLRYPYETKVFGVSISGRNEFLLGQEAVLAMTSSAGGAYVWASQDAPEFAGRQVSNLREMKIKDVMGEGFGAGVAILATGTRFVYQSGKGLLSSKEGERIRAGGGIAGAYALGRIGEMTFKRVVKAGGAAYERAITPSEYIGMEVIVPQEVSGRMAKGVYASKSIGKALLGKAVVYEAGHFEFKAPAKEAKMNVPALRSEKGEVMVSKSVAVEGGLKIAPTGRTTIVKPLFGKERFFIQTEFKPVSREAIVIKGQKPVEAFSVSAQRGFKGKSMGIVGFSEIPKVIMSREGSILRGFVGKIFEKKTGEAPKSIKLQGISEVILPKEAKESPKSPMISRKGGLRTDFGGSSGEIPTTKGEMIQKVGGGERLVEKTKIVEKLSQSKGQFSSMGLESMLVKPKELSFGGVKLGSVSAGRSMEEMKTKPLEQASKSKLRFGVLGASGLELVDLGGRSREKLGIKSIFGLYGLEKGGQIPSQRDITGLIPPLSKEKWGGLEEERLETPSKIPVLLTPFLGEGMGWDFGFKTPFSGVGPYATGGKLEGRYKFKRVGRHFPTVLESELGRIKELKIERTKGSIFKLRINEMKELEK